MTSVLDPPAEARRYRLLYTVHQYARKMVSAQNAAQLARDHATYFLNLATELVPHVWDGNAEFRRRIGTAVAHAVPGWIKSAFQAHTTFLLEHRGLAARTVRKRVWQLTLMAEFWDQTGVTMLPELHVSHIQQFFVQVACQKLATRRTYGVTLRSFLRWAYQEGRLPVDLRAAVITSRQMRQAQVRNVLATEDVGRVRSAGETTPCSCSPSATGCARRTFGSSASTMCSGDGD